VKHPNIMSSVVPHFFCELLDLAETVLALKGEAGHAKGSATGKNVGILKKFIAENHARWRLGKMADGSMVNTTATMPSVLEGMSASASAVSSSASSSASADNTWPNLNDAGSPAGVEDVKDKSEHDLSKIVADKVVAEAAAAAATEAPTVVGA